MKLEQQTQTSSPPKIKKLKQGITTLPLELLVDVFRTINTYSDGFPTDLALDTDIQFNSIPSIHIKIAIIKAKHQELWSKYAKKMMTSSLIIYSFMGEVFRLAKSKFDTLCKAASNELANIEQRGLVAPTVSSLPSTSSACTNPDCINRIQALEKRISDLEGNLTAAHLRISELEAIVAQCKCKKKAHSKLPKLKAHSKLPQLCRVCLLMEPCVNFQDLVVCYPCRTFFRYYAGRDRQFKSCKRRKECARMRALRDCQECRWEKCISLKLDPKKVDVKKRGNVAEES